jgi:hypothetical protein
LHVEHVRPTATAGRPPALLESEKTAAAGPFFLLRRNPLGQQATAAATKATQIPGMFAAHPPTRIFDRLKRTLERNL